MRYSTQTRGLGSFSGFFVHEQTRVTLGMFRECEVQVNSASMQVLESGMVDITAGEFVQMIFVLRWFASSLFCPANESDLSAETRRS